MFATINLAKANAYYSLRPADERPLNPKASSVIHVASCAAIH